MNLEYKKQIKMTYIELCYYLQEKYGLALYDYFATPECKTKNKKVSRTSEGLFCHHIFEDRYGNIGEPHMAKLYPFECQRKKNLVYCNYLEHLIFHLKINANSMSYFEYAYDIKRFFNSLGFFWIASDINELFKNNGSTQAWRDSCFQVIKNDFEDYVSILRGTLCFVEDNYSGEKHISFKEGDSIIMNILNPDIAPDKNEIRGHQFGYTRVPLAVVKISPSEDTIILKSMDHPLSRIEVISLMTSDAEFGFKGCDKDDNTLLFYKLSSFENKYDYDYFINKAVENMTSLSDGTIWEELRKKLVMPFNESDKKVSSYIKDSLSK